MEDVDNFDLAEPIPGPSTDFFGAIAKECGVVIVTSSLSDAAPGLYHNTAVVIERDGTIAGKYRKMHIPDDPALLREVLLTTPGDLGFRPIQTSVGRLECSVCWDQWYPEAARLMALQGAEILIYPTAIGYAASDTPDEQQRQREAWTTVQRPCRGKRTAGSVGKPCGIGARPKQTDTRNRVLGARRWWWVRKAKCSTARPRMKRKHHSGNRPCTQRGCAPPLVAISPRQKNRRIQRK